MLSPICKKFVAADFGPDHSYDWWLTTRGWPAAADYSGFSFDSEGVTFVINMQAEALNGYSIKVPYGELKALFASSSPIYSLVARSTPVN